MSQKILVFIFFIIRQVRRAIFPVQILNLLCRISYSYSIKHGVVVSPDNLVRYDNKISTQIIGFNRRERDRLDHYCILPRSRPSIT
jgi:hypothetical protein